MDGDRNFKIFDLSGVASDESIFEKVGSYSGLEVSNERSITLKHSGNSVGLKEILLSIDTDMGKIEKSFRTFATTEISDFSYTFDENTTPTVYSGDLMNERKTGLFSYNSTLIKASGADLISKADRDIGIWLTHQSGVTGVSGTFFKVTGTDITYSGLNYSEQPSIIVSGGDPITGIDGKTIPAEISGYIDQGYLTELRLIRSGIYNVAGGAPTITVSGGGVGVAVGEYTGSGVVATGHHQKDFTGYWNVQYNSGDNTFVDFEQSGYYEPNIGGYYKSFTIDKDVYSTNIRVLFKNVDEDKMVSKLRIDGYDSNMDEKIITGAISGSDDYLI